MRSSRWASATLAPVVLAGLLAGCGATSAAVGPNHTTCGGSGQADVVVELGNGHVVRSCVPVGAAGVGAETLMRRSGIEFALQHFSYGDAVCQIDQDPRSYSQCFGSGQPYWALYTWAGKGPWRSATTGISDIRVKPGGALGWHFGTGTPAAPPKPPLAG